VDKILALTGCWKVKWHRHSQQTHMWRQTTKCCTEENVDSVNDVVAN